MISFDFICCAHNKQQPVLRKEQTQEILSSVPSPYVLMVNEEIDWTSSPDVNIVELFNILHQRSDIDLVGGSYEGPDGMLVS